MATSDSVAIIGIALTFLASIVNLAYSIRNSTRTNFINTVSASRLKWIDSLRDKVSEFMAISSLLAGDANESSDARSNKLKHETLLHEVILHLNPLDEEDQRIHRLADRVCELVKKHATDADLSFALAELREATGAYLKKEWNRVKLESSGKPL